MKESKEADSTTGAYKQKFSQTPMAGLVKEARAPQALITQGGTKQTPITKRNK